MIIWKQVLTYENIMVNRSLFYTFNFVLYFKIISYDAKVVPSTKGLLTETIIKYLHTILFMIILK